MENIKAQVVRKDCCGTTYRLTGIPSSKEWLDSLKGRIPADHAWCEVTVSEDGYVLGFGGEVWPGAWPELFNPPPRHNYACGSNTVTPLGSELLKKARGVYHRNQAADSVRKYFCSGPDSVSDKD